MSEHPVRLVVTDDGDRSRLTVFFRLLLAIPHFIWFVLWTIAAFVVVVIGWFAVLATGRLPSGMHDFLVAYVRYATHLFAYLSLIANPYPSFNGDPGYDIDVELPLEPAPQSRVRTLFRLPLAIPALFVAAVLSGGTGAAFSRGSSNRRTAGYSGGGLLTAVAVLGWFASLVTGRMPSGLRDAGAYAIGYRAQSSAYLLLLTDHYPNSDPTAMLEGVVSPPPVHPVRIVGDAHDLRRTRLTVFFRILLAIPHIVWLVLWGVLAWLVAIVQWFVVWITGRPAAPLHRFLSSYVRYALHVSAFLFLAANPFPGFAGAPGTYPLDLELPPPGQQGRLGAFFRLLLAVPAFIVNAGLGGALFASAILMWFFALARGTAPEGLRNLSAYALRYSAQASAYLFFVTGAYPHASPLEGYATSDAQLP